MLIELSITPLGRGTHLSKDLAEILKIIDDSEVRYCLTPFGTCLEGEWDQVMEIAKRCHSQARSVSKHVMTTIRIEDEDGVNDKLIANVAAVERAAGRKLQREVLVESK
jgi:uncharacterized protein (TIGR00106 family)